MRHLLGLVAAAAGAAATTYYFDPDMGRHRRAALKRRLRGSPGQPAAPAGATTPERAASRGDGELRDRVRSQLGQLVSHPRGIDVQVTDGTVRLTGDVLAKELDGLLTRVRDMRGVERVINALSAHDNPRSLVRGTGEAAAADEEDIHAHPT